MNLFIEKVKNEFGGSLLPGNRKTRRPLNTKMPHHLVLKATNSLVLLKNKIEVEHCLRTFAARLGIKIYDCAVHADHIHLSLGIPSREAYVRWIRAVTSVLVQKFKNLKWKLRPYTRIGQWGRGFARLRRYILKNRMEGEFIRESHQTVARFRQRLERKLPEQLP
jgi:REP element-mobilizing transposase RayT